MSIRRARWLFAVLLASWAILSVAPVRGRVFTTKSGGDGNPLDNPSSFQAHAIYGGHFRINGRLADMQILSGRMSVPDTLKSLVNLTRGQAGDFRYKTSGGMVLGAVGHGEAEKRVLISSLHSTRSCLIFVLNNMAGTPARGSRLIPWPDALPVLDPSQQPLLVVEHLDTRFLFASVRVPGASAEDAMQRCLDQMEGAGWKTTQLPEKILSRDTNSEFELLSKKDRLCWLGTKRNSTDGSVLVTLLCQIP